MNGTHRNEGVWIAIGPGAEDREAPTRLTAVAPWLAKAMGLAWVDARVDGDSRHDREARQSVVYDDAEEAMVAERLRALGYLE